MHAHTYIPAAVVADDKTAPIVLEAAILGLRVYEDLGVGQPRDQQPS